MLRNCKFSAVSAAVLAMVAVSAQAQTQAPSERLERVEVTGSNIKRVSAETASPVQVYSRTEIKQTGANTVRQVLDTITATSTSELVDNGNSNSFAAGASGVSLRGLGKGATLVLLNGRRVAYYALADGAKENFVNVDAIPADVIERIEILKDGASAVYGSDAMAGVINIITRNEYNGIGISASYQTGVEPKLQKQATAAVVAGFGDLNKDKFNVLGNIEVYKREGYTIADVRPSFAPWHKEIVNPAFGDPSLNSYPGNLIKGKLVDGSFVQASGNPRVPTAACTNKNAAGACVMDINGLNQTYDPASRVNAFVSGRLALNNDLEAFAEASYSKTKTEYLSLPFAINAPATPFRWFDGNAKKIQIVPKPVLAANNPANTTGDVAGLEYRFMDPGMNWDIPGDASQYRVLAGVKGSTAGWDWETTIGRVGADGTKEGIGAHRVDFINAINSGEYKIAGSNSADLLNKMFRKTELKGENHQNFIDAKVSGELYKLPAGMMMGAFGVEYRAESVLVKSGQNLLNAEIINNGSVWVEGSRKLGSAFAEIEAPLAKGLQANVAARFDKASGSDSRLSPKLGLTYLVADNFKVRGTVAGGFRAPNIPEAMGKVGLTGFYNSMVDPKRCETATKIRDILKKGNDNDKADATAAFNSGCLVSIPAMISANPGIKPELSKSMTFGFVFDPVKDLSIAVDYYKIERRNEIANRDPDYVLAREGQAGYDSMIARAPVSGTDLARAARANELDPTAKISWAAGDLTTLLLQYENFGKTERSGIDLDVKGRIGLGELGNLNLGLTTTYALTAKEWDIEANEYRPNRVGLRNEPRVRAVFSAAWSNGPWGAGLRFNYTTARALNNDETDEANWGEAACRKRLNPTGTYPCIQQRDLRTDLSVRYSGFKNLNLGLNVQNLFDEPAPISLRDGFVLRPRAVKVTMDYKF